MNEAKQTSDCNSVHMVRLEEKKFVGVAVSSPFQGVTGVEEADNSSWNIGRESQTS